MFYKRNTLNHFKEIHAALERSGAEASLNASNFHLEVRRDGKTFTLCPQFLKIEEGAQQYTPFFDASVTRFIGWYPYFNKRWDLSNEKLRFKAHAVANALKTPEYSEDPQADLRDVLVKRSVSSFSEGIKGPFHSSKECPLTPGQGEFYERFVSGRIVKLYYLERRAICLEFEKPASVVGDGRSTIKQLVEARAAQRGRKALVKKALAYLHYVGKSLHDVVGYGVEQQIDFKYGSPFSVPADVENVDLTKDMIPELAPQLEAIGERLWLGIPEETRGGALFTVDAIQDAQGTLWLTEMNSNPFVHPFVYPAMLEALVQSGRQAPLNLPQRPAVATSESVNEMLQLAVTQFTSGAVAQAQTLWNKVLALHPTHPTALFYSGLSFAREGKLVDARRLLDLLIKTAPTDNLYFGPAKELFASVDAAMHQQAAAHAQAQRAGALQHGEQPPRH
jgi:hypothetical protein